MTASKLILTAALALAVAAPVYSAEKDRRQRPAAGAPDRSALQGQRGNLEELNLSDEQKEKVRAAMQEQTEALQGIR
jgi:Spy/CpxP family protein refolding chaperone